MKLDEKINKLISRFLEGYSEFLSSECCNDLDPSEEEFYKSLFTQGELIKLEKEYHLYNSKNLDEFDPDHLVILNSNHALPSLLAHKLKNK